MPYATLRAVVPSALLTAALLPFSLLVPAAATAAGPDQVKGNKVQVFGGTFAANATYSLKINAKDSTPGTGTDGQGTVVGTAVDAGAEEWGDFTADVVCVNATGNSARVVARQTSPVPPGFSEGVYYWLIDVEDLGKSSSVADRARFNQAFGGDPEVVIPGLCTTPPFPLFEATGDISVKDGA
jgi:hypothetical protein